MNTAVIRTLSGWFPGLIASYAYKQLTNPQVKKLRAREEEVLDKSEKDVMEFQGFDIQLYKWGSGKEKVMLIHGWEGQAGNFADLVEELLKGDYTIYAFDGPSHGYSTKGKTSLFEFTELVSVLIRRFEVSKLVSHSFGGVATTFALFRNQDLIIDRYVLLTTPDRFIERIEDVSAAVGITEEVKMMLLRRLEQETGENVEGLNVSDFVKEASVAKALIIHDRNDRVIPIERSRNVFQGWKECRFTEIEGTGHFRILREQSVLKETISFLEE